MLTEGLTYSKTITMVTVQCCNCGVCFGMPSDLNDVFKSDSDKYFYCPNGHRQHYSKSNEDKLREQLVAAKAEAERQRQWKENAQQELSKERIERRKVKTRLKNVKERVANGVCPCCNRTFQNLQRHMHTKHPDFKSSEKE